MFRLKLMPKYPLRTLKTTSRVAFFLGLWLVFACLPNVTCAQAEDSEIDRNLLDALDAADDELQNVPDKRRDETTQGPADEVKPADQQPPSDPLDEQLRKQLQGSEDIPLGLDEEEEVDALGEDADPITKIGEKMRLVERLLVKEAAKQRTRKLQDEIVDELAELLKQLQKKQQQQQASSSQSQSKSRQQAQRNKIQQPRTGSQPQQQSPGRSESTKPAQESDQDVRDAEERPIDVVEVREIIKREWGHLPQKDRDEIYRQFGDTEALPESAISIEKYFRRLSEANEE